MFFDDQRCKYPKGNVFVQCEFPFYEPGNIINGKIHLQIFEPIAASHIEIETKGQEKTSFKRFWFETDEEGHAEEKSEKCKQKKKFAHYKQRVFEIPDHQLMPGNYVIDFQFQLQEGLPSSFNLKDKKRREEPKAKVKYYVKTKLITFNEDDEMKYKQVLAIREKPVNFESYAEKQERVHMKTCCCCDQGHCQMKTWFEKNIYTPQETARSTFAIDNSECQLTVNNVSFSVQQRLTLKADHHHFSTTNTLVEKESGSVEPGEKREETLELELDKIKYDCDATKKKKGKIKDVSPEDMFMIKGAQAATHSKLITNEYFLMMKVEFSGCICCNEVPTCSIPLTIIPLINPACVGFMPPPGWEP